MSNILFSIISVCFNEEKHIGETCESVVKQKFKNFEWIVIDGESTDNSIDILNNYQKYIDIFISEKDDGIYDAMNKGISLAKGEFLILLNGGDFFCDKRVLQGVAKYISETNKSYDIYHGDVILLDDNADKTICYANFAKNKNIDIKHFLKGNGIPHQGAFIKKKLFDSIGNYDTSYKITGDFDWWVRAICINKAKPYYLDTLIAKITYGGISTISASKIIKDELKKSLKSHGFKKI